MATYTALTTLEGKETAEALGEAMERLDPEPTGVGVFELEDGSGLWEVGGYFEGPPDDTGLALLAASFGARDFTVSEVPETDWVAKVRRELAPVEAGRFFVYGGHDSEKLPEGRIGLLIEASMAFGTGHHGTTLGCLQAFDRLLDEGMVAHNVADIGCGTAVLAMAAAHVFPETVLATDIDPVAVEVAQANVTANGLEGRVRCVVAAGFESGEIAEAAPFDLVFANILKGPLLQLADPMASVTQSGGRAILSGLLNEQADEVVARYADAGFRLERSDRVGDWTTLTLLRD